MEHRAFGIETEYCATCRRKEDKKFETGPETFSLGIGGEAEGTSRTVATPTMFLMRALPFPDDAPERLKALLFYPNKSVEHYWPASNGAKFYFDPVEVKLPEYATPECQTPKEAIINSMAGDTIVEDIRKEVLRRGFLREYNSGEYDDLFIFRMNTSFGNLTPSTSVVGLHENYLTIDDFSPYNSGKNNFYRFCDVMAPFLISRQIFDGAGGIKPDQAGVWHYVVSQRAFFIKSKAGSATTGGGDKRGLIHFRDDKGESPSGFLRLHLHCGDSNMSPWGKYIAMGATHLVLRALEENSFRLFRYRNCQHHFQSNLTAIASDPTLKAKLCVFRRDEVKEMTALALQKEYADAVSASKIDLSPEEQEILSSWRNMIEKLERDPMDAAEELDWVIKLNYLNERHGGNLANEKARFASVLYHDISERGIYNKILKGGAARPFATAEEVALRRAMPPPTRAEFRSRYLKLIRQNPDNTEHTYSRWECFEGIGGYMITINDPRMRNTEQGEGLLAEFQRMIDRRKK